MNTESKMVASIIEHVNNSRDEWFKEHDTDGIKKKVY